MSSDDKMQTTLNDQYLVSCLILNEIKARKTISPFILEELVVQCSYLIHISSKVEVKDMTKDYLKATSELLKSSSNESLRYKHNAQFGLWTIETDKS